MSGYKLTEEIIRRSMASTWDGAKLEWALSEVYQAEEPETCLCGHYPIIELCVLINKLNRESATVGNCCVKKFMGLPSDLIFQAVKRIRADPEKSLNAEARAHALSKGWITDWQHAFYIDVMRKRNLSTKQLAKKREINARFLMNMRRAAVRSS